jgi:hypothetical protein
VLIRKPSDKSRLSIQGLTSVDDSKVAIARSSRLYKSVNLTNLASKSQRTQLETQTMTERFKNIELDNQRNERLIEMAQGLKQARQTPLFFR